MARPFTPIELPRPDSHDLAWAAGFFDGEGCFTPTQSVKYETSQGTKERRYLRLTVTQKYPELLERMQAMFGVGAVRHYKARPNSSAGYAFTCQGRAAFYVADLLWPYLGEQKKADFKRTLRRVLETRRAWVRHPQRGQTYVTEGGQ